MLLPSILLPLALSALKVGALTPAASFLTPDLGYSVSTNNASTPTADTPLPTVDLGYGVYRASYYNVCTHSHTLFQYIH